MSERVFKKAKRPLEKRTLMIRTFVNNNNQSAEIMTAVAPGTLFGLRWKCWGQQDSELSDWVQLNYAFHHNHDGSTQAQLREPPKNTGVGSKLELLEVGTELHLLGNGFLVTTINNISHGVDDTTQQWRIGKDEGIVKTQRKFQTGDSLELLLRTNAILGMKVYFQITFWYKT